MITSGLFATRTQIGKRIELLLKNRPLSKNGRTLPAALFLLLFTTLVFSLGTEITPQADPHDVYIKSGGDKNRTVSATITDKDNGGGVVTISTKGRIKFNNSKTDVRSISEGGEFRLSSEQDGMERELVVTTDDGGDLVREYTINNKKHKFDDDARKWLAECLENVEGNEYGDYTLLSSPHIQLRKSISAVGGKKPSHIKVEVIESDTPGAPTRLKLVSEIARAITVVDGDDEDSDTIDIYIDEDGGNMMYMRMDDQSLQAHDGHVELKLSPNGKLIIKVDKDGDVHRLEIKQGKRGEREYIYKLNDKEKPYDEDAKKIFEEYLDHLDGGIRIPKGEKI